MGATNGHKRRLEAGTQLELPGTMTLKTRRTVLIVEDALTVRNMLEDFFTMYGYDVLMASDPDTAFKRLKDSHTMLDAMILDIALDDNRSGLEVLELMRLDDRFVDLTVVVLGLALGILAATLVLSRLIETSRLGYSLRAIKENEQAAEAAGIDTFRDTVIHENHHAIDESVGFSTSALVGTKTATPRFSFITWRM